MSSKDLQAPVTQVNSLNFQEEVVDADQPVLVDVSATWCPPCRAAHPVVAELARAYSGRLKVVEINGEEAPDLVARLGVRGFPTFLAMVRGVIVQRSAGFSGRRSLEELARTALAQASPGT